jgi:hypothetical protein
MLDAVPMKRHTIKEILNTDGSRRVVIFQKEDGCYSFREERRVKTSDDKSLWGPLWHPDTGSYPTEEEAERLALSQVEWAASVFPNKG